MRDHRNLIVHTESARGRASQSSSRFARSRLAALAAVVTLAGAALGGEAVESSGPTALRFTGERAETERFLAYEASIELSEEQERVRVEALSSIPAPCCARFSAATCCCKCNMARASWGLAKHLIVERDFDAPQVRDAVARWHRAINPAGFTGDTCFTSGGCARPFAKNGCGGMRRDELVY